MEAPQDFCSTVLPSTYYAPGTLVIGTNPDDLKEEIRKIRDSSEFTMCTELINMLYCIIKYPACNANKPKLIPICYSQCPLIDIQIAQCLLDLRSSDFPLVKELLMVFECDDPQTYINFPSQHVETNQTECLMLSKLQLHNI